MSEMRELFRALRSATRVNMPDSADRAQRIVGFRLPEEIAWPNDGTAHDILQTLLDAVNTRTLSISLDQEGLVEKVARAIAATDAASENGLTVWELEQLARAALLAIRQE